MVYNSIGLCKFQSSIYTPIIETDDKYLCETEMTDKENCLANIRRQPDKSRN